MKVDFYAGRRFYQPNLCINEDPLRFSVRTETMYLAVNVTAAF